MWNVLFVVHLRMVVHFAPRPSLSFSHALWMSWDAASRVCRVCCLLRSNNSLALLAPWPAPANCTTPDRRLTCMDCWHGYCSDWNPQSRVEIHINNLNVRSLFTNTSWLGSSPGVKWHHISATAVHAPPTIGECESRFCREKVSAVLDWCNNILTTQCTVESSRVTFNDTLYNG